MRSLLIPSSSADLENQFRLLAEDLAGHYRQNGVEVRPYYSPKLLNFSALSEENKNRALFGLHAFTKITRHGQNQGSFAESLQSIFRHMNLHAKSDFFSKLETGDAIELYDFNGLQLWCNLETRKISSYTIEENHSFTWLERYERGKTDTQHILQILQKLANQKEGEIVAAMMPSHYVQERFSEKMFLLKVQHKYFIPLYSQGSLPAAFMVTSKVKILSALPNWPKLSPALT